MITDKIRLKVFLEKKKKKRKRNIQFFIDASSMNQVLKESRKPLISIRLLT